MDEDGTFTAGEVLPDLSGPGVHEFAFSGDVARVYLRTVGGDGRVDPFGGQPDEGRGIPLPAGEIVELSLTTNRVAVYLPAGVTAVAWGYR